MRIAICDDIQDYNIHLEKLLKKYMKDKEISEYVIKIYNSGSALLKELQVGTIDFLFLDIDMPTLDGFDTAEAVKRLDRDVYIIFVTNDRGGATKGYNYNAKGYLCKPLEQNDIDSLLDRVIDDRVNLYDNGFYRIKIKKEGTAYVRLDDIIYFESFGHDIVAVTHTSKYTFLGKLETVLTELEPKGFVRIHRSYIVNMLHVFRDFGNKVILKKNGELPVSDKFKKSLQIAFEGRASIRWKAFFGIL